MLTGLTPHDGPHARSCGIAKRHRRTGLGSHYGRVICQALVIVGTDLLDVDDVRVARTAIAQAGGVGFRRFAPTEREGATPVGRPSAVIITDDSLGLAVAESNVVDGQGGTSFEFAKVAAARPLFRGDDDKAGTSCRPSHRALL